MTMTERTTQASVSAAAIVRAPAARVYAILADYRQHHPRIVPPEYFRKVEVVEGGVGAGTRTRIEMRVLGMTKRATHIIREPEPGRVLEEVDADGFSVTTFVVDPADNGASASVSIRTTFTVRSGPLGALERLLTTAVLRRIYTKELARIGTYAATV
jgi:polyketide cyclase/dehydrase/lipid transport protein